LAGVNLINMRMQKKKEAKLEMEKAQLVVTEEAKAEST